MKYYRKSLIVILLIFSGALYAKNTPQKDSATNQNANLQIIKQQKIDIDRLNDKIDKLSNAVSSLNSNMIGHEGNYLSHDGNTFMFVTIILMVVSMVVGVGGYITIDNARQRIKTAEKSLALSDAALREKIIEINLFEERMKTLVRETEAKVQDIGDTEETTKEHLEEILTKKNNILKDIGIMREDFTSKTNKIFQTIPIYYAAIEKLNAGNIDVAISKFQKILDIDPLNITAQSSLAMCYSGKDDVKAAMDVIPIINAPNVTEEALVFCGIIMRRVERFSDAVNLFKRALKFDKKIFSTYNHLGYTYMYQSDFINSKKSFLKAMKLRPKNSASNYGLLKLSYLYPESFNEQEKEGYLTSAIKNAIKDNDENPTLPYYQFGLAFALMCENKEGEVCIKELEKALHRCKNLGILKEQLLDYELLKKHNVRLIHLEECISMLSDAISTIKSEN